jgi:3-(3-hydroxy-phenyl)propionate hydroxylase
MTHVIVVGAGPVGLVAALGLVRNGIRVTLLDAAPAPIEAPRAAAYQYVVLEVLHDVGILADVEDAGIRVTRNNFRLLATGETYASDLSKLEGLVPFPYNVNLGQGQLSQIALRHLRSFEAATIRFGAEVAAVDQAHDSATVVLSSGERLQADWVVGADGGRSTTRKSIGSDFPGFTWQDRFVATNIRYDFAAHGFGSANMVMDADFGCIVAELGNGLWRVTFNESDELPEVTIPDRVTTFMNAFLPGPKEFELAAFSPYRMHQRAAETFRAGRVLLAGDAAHVTNPTGALGLTTGLLDVEVLVPALVAVIEGRADPDVLDAYSDVRRRSFLEKTSPLASDFKRLVYNGTQAELEAAFFDWREMLDDTSREVEFLRRIQGLRSEQVVAAPAM